MTDVSLLEQEIAILWLALPDPDKLEQVAKWLDLYDILAKKNGYDVGGSEMQDDLRTWAKRIRDLKSITQVDLEKVLGELQVLAGRVANQA